MINVVNWYYKMVLSKAMAINDVPEKLGIREKVIKKLKDDGYSEYCS